MIPNLHLQTKQVDGDNVPILPKPYTAIVQAIERQGLQHFDMNVLVEEYSCGTVRCIAGWTLYLCGAQGVEFSNLIGRENGSDGTVMNDLRAAHLILDASSNLPVPKFCPHNYEEDGSDSDEDINARALTHLRELAAQEAAYA
jgi:hypothetical protein